MADSFESLVPQPPILDALGNPMIAPPTATPEQTALNNFNLSTARGAQPDSEGPLYDLSRQSGVPIEVLRSVTLPTVAQRQTREQIAQKLVTNPTLTEWMASDPSRAVVASDDLNELAHLQVVINDFRQMADGPSMEERVWSTLASPAVGAVEGLGFLGESIAGSVQFIQETGGRVGVWLLEDELREAGLNPGDLAEKYDRERTWASDTARIANELGQRFIWEATEGHGVKGYSDAWNAYSDYKDARYNVVFGVAGLDDLSAGVVSLAPTVLAAPLGLPGIAAAAGLQSFGGTFARKRREDVGFGESAGLAFLSGAITGALTAGFARLGQYGGIDRWVLNQFGSKALTGTALEGAKRATRAQLAVLMGKQAFGEFVEEGMDEVLQGLLVDKIGWTASLEQGLKAGVIGGVLAGGAHGSDVLFYRRNGRAARAVARGDGMQGIAEAGDATKTKDRSPEMYREFLQSQGIPEDGFVDRAVFRDVIDADPQLEAVIQDELGIDTATMDTVVQIEVPKVMTLTNTDLRSTLLENLRSEPDQMSAVEGRKFQGNKKTEAERAVRDMKNLTIEQSNFRAETERLVKDVVAATGYSRDLVLPQVTVIAQRVWTMWSNAPGYTKSASELLAEHAFSRGTPEQQRVAVNERAQQERRRIAEGRALRERAEARGQAVGDAQGAVDVVAERQADVAAQINELQPQAEQGDQQAMMRIQTLEGEAADLATEYDAAVTARDEVLAEPFVMPTPEEEVQAEAEEFADEDLRVFDQISKSVIKFARETTGVSMESEQVIEMLTVLSEFDTRVRSIVGEQRTTASEIANLLQEDPAQRNLLQNTVNKVNKKLGTDIVIFNKDHTVSARGLRQLQEAKEQLPESSLRAAVATFTAGHGRPNAFEINKALAADDELQAVILTLQDEINKTFGNVPILNRAGQLVTLGIEDRTATYDNQNNNPYKPQFGGFARSFAQTFMDYLPDTVFEAFRRDLTLAVEFAYANRDTLINPVGIFEKTIETVSKTMHTIAPPLRAAEKTNAAINLNSACPMFMIGSHGCYLDGCYVTGQGRGGNTFNLYNRAAYTGEILQLSDADIRLLNSVGGLRINGAGDLTSAQYEQLRDVVRHAKLQNLALKVITKQDATVEMIARMAREDGVDIGGVQVQPSIDPYWVPVSEDDLAGSLLSAFPGLVEALQNTPAGASLENLQDMVIETYESLGLEAKLIDGRVYRKYGFSLAKFDALVAAYPEINFQPRAVVGNPEEIIEFARERPDVLQTWMHAAIPGGMYSDVVGSELRRGAIGNYTARIAVLQDSNGEWHIYAQAAKGSESIVKMNEKLGILERAGKGNQKQARKLRSRIQKATAKRAKDVPLDTRSVYTAVETAIKAQPDADQIFRTLAGQLDGNPSALCCAAGADQNACNNCTSHCHANQADWTNEPVEIGAVPELVVGTGQKKGAIRETVELRQEGVEPADEPIPDPEIVRDETVIPEDSTPVTIEYIRNTEAAPDMGTRFGQDIEPSGRYMQVGKQENIVGMPNMVSGVLRFENPIVMEFGEGYGKPGNWKAVLSQRFDGKTGLELSEAIRAAGHDGIITINITSRGERVTSEIVDLGGVEQPTVLDQPGVTAPLPPDQEAALRQEFARVFPDTPITTIESDGTNVTVTAPGVGNVEWQASESWGRLRDEFGLDVVVRPEAEVDEAIGEDDLGRTFESREEYFQADESIPPRASVIPFDDVFLATIFKDRDLSSVLHESGHIYLEQLRAIVRAGFGNERLIADWDLLTNWLGIVDERAPITREQHEQFARGSEQYFMEGVTPSAALSSSFMHYRRWLTNIYRTTPQYFDDVHLTDEIRMVFDRSLASDKEIDAKALENSWFMDDEALQDIPNFGPARRSRMRQTWEDARMRIAERLVRMRARKAAAQRAEWRAEIETELRASRVYLAWDAVAEAGGIRWEWLRTQEIIGGHPVASDEAVEIQLKAGVPLQGIDVTVSGLPIDFGDFASLTKKGLLAPESDTGVGIEDIVTEDWDSVQDLLNSLVAAKPIRAELDAWARTREAESDLEVASVEAVIEGPEFRELEDALGRWLNSAMKTGTPIAQRRALRMQAEAQLAKLPLHEAVAAHLFMQQAYKAHDLQVKAIAQDDFGAAIEHNREVRLQIEKSKLAQDLKKRMEKAEKEGKKTVRTKEGTIEEAYLWNYGTMAVQWGLIKEAPRLQMPKDAFGNTLPTATLTGLLEWERNNEVMGLSSLSEYSPTFKDGLNSTRYQEILAERGDRKRAPYKYLTYDEFWELEQILGRLKSVGKALRDESVLNSDKTLTEVKEEMKAQMEQMPDTTPKQSINKQGGKIWARFGDYMKSEVVAPLIQVDQFVWRKADNYNGGGRFKNIDPDRPHNRHIETEASIADNQASRRIRRMSERIQEPLEQIARSLDKMPKTVKSAIPVPEDLQVFRGVQEWETFQVFSMAFNMGTAYNLNSLAEGYGFVRTDENGDVVADIRPLLELTKILSEADWQAVQKLGDIITEELWPDTFDTHQRQYGVSPVKVDPDPITVLTSSGSRLQLRGWYWPVRFDSRLHQGQAALDERAALREIMGAMFAPVSARRGHTMRREGSAGKPILLDFQKVLRDHISYGVRFITHSEFASQANRIFRDPDWARLFIRKVGQHIYNELNGWLRAQLLTEHEQLNTIDRITARVRSRTSLYYLGFMRLKGALNQTDALVNLPGDVGFHRLKEASIRMNTPKKAWAEYENMMDKSEMMHDRLRGGSEQILAERLKGVDVTNVIHKTFGKGVKIGQHVGLWPIIIPSLGMEFPYWVAMYHSELARTGDEDRAIAYADDGIGSTQPDTRIKARSRLQRSRKWGALIMTILSSYRFKRTNANWHIYANVKAGRMTGVDAFVYMFNGWLLGPMMPKILLFMIWAGFAALKDDDDEEDLPRRLKEFGIESAEEILTCQVGGIPFTETGTRFMGRMLDEDKRQRGLNLQPRSWTETGWKVHSEAARAFMNLPEAIDSEDPEMVGAAIWELADLLGFWAGIPITRAVDDVREGVRQYNEEYGTGLGHIVIPEPAKRERR